MSKFSGKFGPGGPNLPENFVPGFKIFGGPNLRGGGGGVGGRDIYLKCIGIIIKCTDIL